MSEAPEKIWYDPQAGFADEKQQYPEDISYIRADLVDELIEALEDVMDAYGDRLKELSYQQGILVGDSRIANAKAALAKVRGEKNDNA